MGKVIILPETTKDPISLIGRRAGICWGSDVSDEKKNYARGLNCIKYNHGRTLEFVNIESILWGYSARVIREWYTHIGGSPTRLQASTRYVDYTNFEYVIPDTIKIEEQRMVYCDMMESISKVAQVLEESGVPREDVAMLFPLGMSTKVVDKRNLRNVIDMSRQRMCSRAYWEYRMLFNDYINALKNISSEWEYIIETQMKSKCEVFGYCTEKHSCGRKPNKVNSKN